MVEGGKAIVFVGISVCFGLSPLPVTVTTRIIPYLVGNPYEPSFPLLLGGGTTQCMFIFEVAVFFYRTILEGPLE